NSSGTDSSSQTIEIIEPPSSEWNISPIICSSESPIDLNALVTGTPNGIFSGTNVGNNIFSPQNLSGDIELTYSVGTGDCISEKSIVIEVIYIPTPELMNDSLAFCAYDAMPEVLVSNSGEY